MADYIEMKVSGVKVRIETDQETINIFNVVDDLIEPALLGLGFHQKTVNEILISEEDENK